MEIRSTAKIRAEVELCPRVKISRDEYQRRFADLDLGYYRNHMSPQDFKWFVESAAVVQGVPGPRPEQSLEDYL